jgi:hypothetical protein
MRLEIEGTAYEAGTEPTVHLAFNVPMPDPNVPFATSVAPAAAP